MPHIHAHLLPDLIAENALAGAAVVVMDVLRATTTLTYALWAGVGRVIACLEVDDARQVAESLKRQSPQSQEPLLAGERNGVRIAGFDLGNSPAEYTRETVGGRTLVFTTTNGTRAMLRCRQAGRVLLGSLVNRRAVVRLVGEDQIHLVCAGTRGEITREDALCAGALVAGIIDQSTAIWQLNDQARLVLAAWQNLAAAGIDAAKLAAALHETQGGRNLLAEGLESDIPWAAQLDRFDLVPRFDPADSSISIL